MPINSRKGERVMKKFVFIQMNSLMCMCRVSVSHIPG
jgi:hypothetical protein